ncbi:MAG: hypothetical protein RL754_831 [Bacteroidota bacterium]|jgi:tetratricopeptide (TPR) repeat protein
MEDALVHLGDSAKTLYDAGNYRQALEAYAHLEAAQVKQSSLFHNMGNCYVRLGELGEARVYFERALVFDPNNVDAQHNLDWLKMRLTDHLIEPRQELIDWLSIAFRGILPTQAWGILAWTVLLVTIVLLLVRRFGRGMNWRYPFTTSLLGLLLLLTAWISIPKSFIAVNTAANSYGYSEPYAKGKRVVLLGEGSAGRLISENDNWLYIELGDGRVAWFNAEEWERVLHYPKE